MENHFIDRFRADRPMLEKLRAHLTQRIAGRRCIIMGSAPDPVVPPLDGAFTVCVNGSVYSAYKHWAKAPDLTYLNGAIFNDNDSYSNATLTALSGKHLGDAIIARHSFELALRMMGGSGITYDGAYSFSKYDKRVVLGDAAGHGVFGSYPFEVNVSNGIFMANMALWAGAADAVLVGFSFNSAHAYSTGKELSTRGHIREDSLFLAHIAKSSMPVLTTSVEINERFGIRLLE